MNTPNNLDNDLDQVPKTGTRYELVLDDLKNQIIDAFDKFENNNSPMEENDFFIIQPDKDIVNWYLQNSEKLPMEQVMKLLKNVRTVSCEVQRKKKENTDWWMETIWPAISIDKADLWRILTRNGNSIQGNIVTYITFTKLNNKQERPDIKITTKQIEFPWEGVQIPRYVVYQKDLTGEELKKENIVL